ncbi:L-ribulose-5-phosphate 4-epimerase AraD [Marinococcus sp. PL1-022]|uniref:L-ribulose-5-phosphate 4-epimerase AraD n=1 Tax=Marinococcus sp. PL1-022 TaxID=3095363 RepID=UPI0029C118EE|nr:L-ribulose-5-phosphate 4-epimerase AraD [Marinococcus sp. PL1-022]MDX6153184.1 L-ribulose-5-phosphate 4-epimerase AraD [Marinococcus sp. PL1-022]
MLELLKQQVCSANQGLVDHDLVTFTWGNVSGFDPEAELLAIKPSGVPYEELSPEDIVLVDLKGNVVEGDLKPSSDTPTHIELYKAFPGVRGIVHTHSDWGTAWAQAGKSIPCSGTTQADYFYGDIPCTRQLTKEEVQNGYEKETGSVIIEAMHGRNPVEVPGIVVHGHAPFAWGGSPEDALHNAVVLEKVAKMTFLSYQLSGELPLDNHVLQKHYERKHGENAYYGQSK